MIRSILIPLSEGPLPTVTRDFAFWLARKEGSSISALAVIDVKAFEIPVLGTPDGFMPSVVTPPVAESQSLMAELAALARERLDQLARECASAGVPCSIESRTGVPEEIIARQAVAHDIVIMSREGYSRGAQPDGRMDPLVSHVIRTSVRPVLVAGRRFPESGEVRRILVAYDGSFHASRALPMVAELGSRPGVECVIATIAASLEAGREINGPAEAFLYHHGLVPRTHVAVGTRAADLICGLTSSMRADLLIMGAYGHAPVREMLFGSTTERVLSHCETSVVLQS